MLQLQYGEAHGEKRRNRPRTTIALLLATGSRVPLERVKEFTYFDSVEQRMAAAHHDPGRPPKPSRMASIRGLQLFGRVFRRTRANPVTELLHELWDDEGRPTYERSKPSWLKQVRTDIDNSMNFQDVYNQATWESDCLEAGDPYEG